MTVAEVTKSGLKAIIGQDQAGGPKAHRFNNNKWLMTAIPNRKKRKKMMTKKMTLIKEKMKDSSLTL